LSLTTESRTIVIKTTEKSAIDVRVLQNAHLITQKDTRKHKENG